jgi:hypothetical protein
MWADLQVCVGPPGPALRRVQVELDREVDGRWIADIAELNVLFYAESKGGHPKGGACCTERSSPAGSHTEVEAANPEFAAAA